MKKLILFIVLLLPLMAEAQPAPTFEASSAQTAAGTVGAPFYVSPRRLGSFGFIATNLPLSTATNIAQGVANTTSNSLMVTTWGAYTNVVVFSNGPPVAGQAFVIVGTNANGSVIVKGTNWPTGGTGTGTLLPPNALGVLTNNGSGASNWSTSIPGTWVGLGTLPRSAADSTWASATNYPASTNSPIGTLNQVPLATAGTNTFGSPTFNWGSLPVAALSFSVATNAFTNVVVGYLRLTNIDGLVFTIPVGTNMP